MEIGFHDSDLTLIKIGRGRSIQKATLAVKQMAGDDRDVVVEDNFTSEGHPFFGVKVFKSIPTVQPLSLRPLSQMVSSPWS
jgi:hypothetical protein